VTVATRVPGGVICLISALAFHELTTQIPHELQVALPRGEEEPRLTHPPIKTYRFTGQAFSEGMETHQLDLIMVRIYNPEKTLADCFKYRNKVGLDTAMEAVRFYRERKPVRVDDLMHYAEICRVKRSSAPISRRFCNDHEQKEHCRFGASTSSRHGQEILPNFQ
jgi:predicted transcriptional regulator of viral defense system